MLNRFEAAVANVFMVASSAAAILFTERQLAERFRIHEGFPRRLVAGCLALIPLSIAVRLLGPHSGGWGAVGPFLALLVIDWTDRWNPNREDRISVTDALGAGILATFFTMFIDPSYSLYAGAALFGTSLLVNALSPYLPKERRREMQFAEEQRRASEFLAGGISVGTHPGGVHVAFGKERRPDPEPAPLSASNTPPSNRPAPHERPEVATSEPSRATPSSPPDELPTGPTARVLWPLVAATLIGGGVSCFAAILLTGNAHYYAPALAPLGAGLLGMSGFALHRGLWARYRGPWRRTLRPLALWTFVAGALASGAFLLASVLFGFESAGTLSLGVVALSVSLGGSIFFVVMDRLETPAAANATSGPWAPVSPISRGIHLFLSSLLFATAFGAVVASSLPHALIQHFLPGVILTIGCAGGALFFLHQGLRAVRGTLWRGHIRPFLLCAAVTCVAMAGTLLAQTPDRFYMHDGAQLVLIVSAIFAGVFGIFAYWIQGDSPPRPANVRAAQPASGSGRGHRILGGWLVLGRFAWLIGVPVLLYAALVETGAFHSLFPEVEVHPEFATASSLRFGIALCVFGAFALAMARVSAGSAHLVRSLLASASFLGATAAFLFAADRVVIEQEAFFVELSGHEDNFIIQAVAVLVLACVGLILASWPPKWAGETRDEKHPGGEVAS